MKIHKRQAKQEEDEKVIQTRSEFVNKVRKGKGTMGRFVGETMLMLVVLIMAGVVKSQVIVFPTAWKNAQASYYGGRHDGSVGSTGNGCGYGKPYEQGYGFDTAAVSGRLFNHGEGCGACYEVKCQGEECKGGSVIVTASNLCPAEYNQGLCSSGADAHFALSANAFFHIATQQSKVVPVQYRRVWCQRQRGVRFTISGDDKETEVLITNLGGGGNVDAVRATWPGVIGWKEMTRSSTKGGQVWIIAQGLKGQTITFELLTGDGRQLTASAVIPRIWASGNTFEGPNFLDVTIP